MKIVKQLPKKRQTMLFSATMVEEVQKVVNQVMIDPVEVEFEVSKPAESVDQQIYFAHPKQKLSLFEQLFDADKYKTAIVFCATKRGTDKVERMLKKRGVNAVSMHGDRDQEERNEALRLFKNKTHPVMVATDVLSRGIDIDDVSLIVNFDVPNNPEDYIHRIGRTGRYDKEGTAITFVSNKDKKYYHAIKNVVGDQLTIKDLPDDKPDSKDKKEKKGQAKKSNKAKQKSKQNGQPNKSKQDSSGKKTLKPRPTHDVVYKGAPKDFGKKKASNNGQDKTKQEPKDKKKKQESKDKGGDEPKKKSKKRTSGRSAKRERELLQRHQHNIQEEDIFQPEIIEKAVARNRKSLRPAKGIWGIIKSYIPKIG